MSHEDEWQKPVPEPNIFQKLIILIIAIISDIFWEAEKQQRGKRISRLHKN